MEGSRIFDFGSKERNKQAFEIKTTLPKDIYTPIKNVMRESL